MAGYRKPALNTSSYLSFYLPAYLSNSNSVLLGWPESEVSALLSARIAGKSDEEIRVLVGELEAIRKDIVPIIRQATE